MDNGNDRYRTFLGAILSIGSVMTLLLYTIYKVIMMFSFKEYQIQVHDHENYYERDDQWGTSEFMLAAAVTAFDGSSLDITDPSIGELKLYRKQWQGSNGDSSAEFLKEVEMRPCNIEELLRTD